MQWDPQGYARHGRFVAELGTPLIELLAPAPGDRTLDLGCGDGALTVELAARGCRVLGIDASAAQVAATRARGLEAEVFDAQALHTRDDLRGRFDGILSNAALHWMPRQDRVALGMAHVLKAGGRCVLECGGAGNVERVRTTLHAVLTGHGIDPHPRDPWTFPEPDILHAHLQAAGLVVETSDHFPRPTVLPGDIGPWLTTFASPFLADLSAAARCAVIDEVRRRLAPDLCRDGIWTLDYVRLRLRFSKP